MRKLTVAVLISLSSVSGQTHPLLKVQTAGFVADACKVSPKSSTADDAAASAFCTGLFAGWRSVIDELPVLTPNCESRLSIDSTAEVGQLLRVFVAYVSNHPEVENKEAFLVFCVALKSTGLMTETKVSDKSR